MDFNESNVVELTVGQTARQLELEKFSMIETLSRIGLSALTLACVMGISCVSCGGAPPGTIGAALGQGSDGRVFVREIPPGEGADKAGLQLDDEILAIDGKPVDSMTQDSVRSALRGELGSTMSLTIERDGHRLEVKVVRSPLLGEKDKK